MKSFAILNYSCPEYPIRTQLNHCLTPKDPSRKTRAARDIETQEEDNACLTSPEKPVTYLFELWL